MSQRFVFIMDPLDRIDIEGDSTFALMLEVQKRGHAVYFALVMGLELDNDQPWITAQPAEVRRKAGDHFTLGEPERFNLNDAAAVFMRKDPPIGYEYIASTFILEHIDRSRVVCVNNPQALRDCNEKLYALRWPHLIPRTIVARSPSRLRGFIEEVGEAVVKPLYGAGGAGVIKLVKGDKNTRAVIDLMTQEGQIAITAQTYLPAVTEGDRRIILVAGEPAGVINRRPSSDDLRSNMHVGGTAEPAEMTDRDREICAALKDDLIERGIPFAGIDVIGGYLTEINLTSPTGLQEIARFDGTDPTATLIDWVDAEVGKCR